VPAITPASHRFVVHLLVLGDPAVAHSLCCFQNDVTSLDQSLSIRCALNYPGSPDTILRLVKQNQLPTTSSPRVVGIDGWRWKRGLRYGTLICHLENNRPIDVLPDRSVQAVSA